MKKCSLIIATCLLLSLELAFAHANNSTVCPVNLTFVNDTMWKCTASDNHMLSNCYKDSSEDDIVYVYQVGSIYTQYPIKLGMADSTIPQVVGDGYVLGGYHDSVSIEQCSSSDTTYYIYEDSLYGFLRWSKQDPSQHQQKI